MRLVGGFSMVRSEEKVSWTRGLAVLIERMECFKKSLSELGWDQKVVVSSETEEINTNPGILYWAKREGKSLESKAIFLDA